MVTESLIIGLVIGIIFYELFELSPGGIVTPGYLALFIHLPNKIFVTFILAFLVYGILELLTRWFIIYGKRRFLLALLLGFCGKLVIEHFIQPASFIQIDLQSVGYIIPGLIANEFCRQKIIGTIVATGIVTLLTYLALILIR